MIKTNTHSISEKKNNSSYYKNPVSLLNPTPYSGVYTNMSNVLLHTIDPIIRNNITEWITDACYTVEYWEI